MAIQDYNMSYPVIAGSCNDFATGPTVSNFFKEINVLRCPSDTGTNTASVVFNRNTRRSSYAYAVANNSGAGITGVGGRKASSFRSPTQKAVVYEPTLDPSCGRSWHTTYAGSGVVGFMDTHAQLSSTNYSGSTLTADEVPSQTRMYY